MPNSVIPQVEVGALALRGLTGFIPLLAACSADDVAPVAMIQLEQMGAVFHTNGKYAASVPGLLQRCSSTRLDHLGLLVGWRKGDTVSAMAQSAAGQAVALLCFCLRNLFSYEKTGSILFDLSKKVLSREMAVAGVGQLARAADLLATKLLVLGYGNIVAGQTQTIQDVYRAALSKPCPRDFFQPLTSDCMVDLLYSFSRAFTEQNCIVQVWGTSAMSDIIAIASILFPEDLMLTIDGTILRRGERDSILIEVHPSSGSGQIQVEKKLQGDKPLSATSVSIRPSLDKNGRYHRSFLWDGHLADALQLGLSDFGVQSSTDLNVACCDILSHMVPLVGPAKPVCRDETKLPQGGLWNMWGPEPLQRVHQVCKTIFRCLPSGRWPDAASAYSHLVSTFRAAIGPDISCTCNSVHRCDLSRCWMTVQEPAKTKSEKTCVLRLLWRHVGRILTHGMFCFLVDRAENATIRFIGNSFGSYNLGLDQLCEELGARPSVSALYPSWGCEYLHRGLMRFTDDKGATFIASVAAQSDGSSTVFPASLLHLHLNPDTGVRYLLFDGQLVFEGRYYRRLDSAGTEARRWAHKSIFTTRGGITPSSDGEHSATTFSIKESIQTLELRTTILVGGQNVPLNLVRTIVASMGITDGDECEHALSTKLSSQFENDVYTTSVASPQAGSSNKIAIVQTKHNPTAQLFACEDGVAALLQRRCCLNCAVLQCRRQGLKEIIVAS